MTKTIQNIVDKLPNDSRHIITYAVVEDDSNGSFSVSVDENGNIEYEYPELIPLLMTKFYAQKTIVMILRSFDMKNKIPAPWKPEIMVPMKTVQGWVFSEGEVVSLSASEIFEMSCIDSETGELLPPEETVEYIDAMVI